MLGEIHVIVMFVLALAGCLVYVLTRYRRRARLLWGFMALPCLEIILLYAWFLLAKVPAIERVQPARAVLLALGGQIAATAFLCAWRDYRNVRH